MLSDDKVHERLLQWAWWRKSSNLGDGYPKVNVLHRSWMPGRGSTVGGQSGAARSDDALHRRTQAAVDALSRRLSETVRVHYLIGGPMLEQALRLGCAESTVRARVREARRQIAPELQF